MIEAFAAPSPAPTSAEPAVEPIAADKPMELAIAGATNGIATATATVITVFTALLIFQSPVTSCERMNMIC